MEKNHQQEMLQCELSHNSNIGIEPIGRHKYQNLKTLAIEHLTDLEKKQIAKYEAKGQPPTDEQTQKKADYIAKVRNPAIAKEFSITALQLWNLFINNFEKVNGRPFIKIGGIDGQTVKNLEPLIYYFAKDERFFKCENISKLSVPSFDKGLLIIGNFGNGKTSTMKVFEHIFKQVSGYSFKGYTSNEAVLMFEKCGKDLDREEFEKSMWRGVRYFDDLKTERIASNFGKVNIFKEILEERYSRKSKTYVTCNFKDGFKNNIEEGVNEFVEKYGERVYDRLFEMFNIIEFKGESFRK